MSLRRGDVLANRFELHGDEQVVRSARHHAVVAAVHRRQTASPGASDLWLRGVDRVTGAPVLIEPRHPPNLWEYMLETETRARMVASAAPPFVVEVLLAGPRVVYSEPPAGAPYGTFSRGEAAGLALQACEAAAWLHAAGIAGLRFDPFNLRVAGKGASARIYWLVPCADDLAMISTGERLIYPAQAIDSRFDAVESDIRGVVRFFLSLLPAESRISIDNVDHGRVVPDMAALARRFLPLVPASTDVVDRVAALPSVTSVPRLRFDWDHVIADGEARLARITRDQARAYITLPLAAAYHQRACREWARGDRAAALRDAERAVALDRDFLSYEVTRAVLLDALGRGEEAYLSIDRALRRSARRSPQSAPWGGALPDADLARAHALRGSIALRRGDPAGAAVDLRRAMALRPCAAHAHAFGAALYALGDFKGAAGAEAWSVKSSPANTRYRWALVGSLRRLGLDSEALAQAERIIALEPDNASHREKLAALKRLISTRGAGPW